MSKACFSLAFSKFEATICSNVNNAVFASASSFSAKLLNSAKAGAFFCRKFDKVVCQLSAVSGYRAEQI